MTPRKKHFGDLRTYVSWNIKHQTEKLCCNLMKILNDCRKKNCQSLLVGDFDKHLAKHFKTLEKYKFFSTQLDVHRR